jgi:hypothetical protein
LYGHLVLAVWYFPPLWYVAPRIIWQHWCTYIRITNTQTETKTYGLVS